MARDKVRKLRDEASKALDKGRHAKAAEAYRELEALEPSDANWSRRAADCYRRLDRRDDMIDALLRAGERYAAAGFLVKAIAVYKMILAADAEHELALAKLGDLHEARGIPMKRAPEPPPPAPPPATRTTPRARTLPPGAAVEAVSLSQVIPDAKPVGGSAEEPSGIYEIPIDEIEFLSEEDAQPEPAVAAAEQVFPRTPLFSELSPAALGELARKVELVELARGQALFRQGDAPDALYVVAEGAVAVVAEGPPRVQLNRLEDGEFFGEIGLLSDQPRMATVEAADDDTAVVRIHRDVIGDVVEVEPGVLKVLLRFMRDRLLEHLVQTSPLFEPFAGSERSELAGRFRFLEAEQGAELVRQGERAEGLFVLLTGKAEVARDGKRLATLGAGDLFGEMSLLTHEPAVATVRATSKCLALQLPAPAFREVIMTHPQVLMFVGDLADERRRQNEAIAGGDADYAEGHIDLL